MSDILTLRRLMAAYEKEWRRARNRSWWWTSLSRRLVNDRVSDFAYEQYTAIKRKYDAAAEKVGQS